MPQLTERMDKERRAVLFAYLEASEQDPDQKLAAWIKRYPQFEDDLIQFAVYHHVVEQPAHSVAEADAIADIGLDIEMAALDQAFVGLVAPLTSLVARARALALNPATLADALGLGVDIILKLERRVLIPASIPGGLLERLAERLDCGVVQVRVYLSGRGGQPAPAFYHSKQPPATTAQQSFAEAVRESRMMGAEQKAAWLKLVEWEADADG